MLSTIMEYCNNYFKRNTLTVTAVFGSNTITFSATLTETFIAGQYIKIFGSILNDDVYKIVSVTSNTIVVEETLVTEPQIEISLSGLAIPQDFITIVGKIEADITAGKYNDVAEVKRGDVTIKYGSSSTSSWQDDYTSVLFPYKKVRLV